MRTKVLFLSLWAVSTIIVSCNNDSVVDEVPSMPQPRTSETTFSPDVTFNMSANITYNKLLDSFNNKVSRSGNQEQEYPDYYGGAFINDQNNLTVYIYQPNGNVRTSALQSLTQDNNIVTKPCDYSYNYLLGLMQKVRRYKAENPNSELTKKFCLTVLKEIENRVYVYLLDCDKTTIQSFKENISDSPAIYFFEGEKSEMQAANNINPGNGIYYQDSQGTHTGSMGYRAKRNNVMGIVTAGHVASTKGIQLYSSFNGTSKYFGESEYAVISGAVDACFIKTYSGFEGTNILEDANLYAVAMTPAVNTIVNLRSYVGHKWGPIKDLHAEADYGSGLTLTNLMSIDYNETPIGGESGGIVYAVDSSSKLRYTVGLHGGRLAKTGYAYTIKAIEANKALSLTQY